MLLRLRTKLSDFAASMDGFAARLAPSMGVLFLWPALLAVALGSSVFVVRHLTWIPVLDTNKVTLPDSVVMTKWVAGTFGVIWLFQLAVLVVKRVRHGRSGGFGTLAEIQRRLRLLLVLPIILHLTLPAIERDSPKETLFFVALCAALASLGAYAWLRAPGVDPPAEAAAPDAPVSTPRWQERAARLGAAAAVTVLWAGYGGLFSYFALVNHRALNTRTIDLGYYDNIFWQSIHGKPLACSFIKAGYHGSAHFDPLLVLLSPLYLIYPRAEFLLVLQSVWLGAGVVPVYLIARHRLGTRPAAVALAAMYALYPALHGANMYDFHSLTLLTPIVLWLLYFLGIGAVKRYWLALVPALLCREDAALLMCFVGLYAILTREPRKTRLGWVTILVSLGYFAIVKRFFMTSRDVFMSGPNSYSFAYYYDEMIPNHNGVAGLVVSLVTNPAFVVRTMLGEPKILYLLTLFLPLLFLPFFARTARVMLVYGVLFCLLASRGAVYSIHFQYSSVIIPIAFAITPEALRRAQDSDLARRLGLEGRRFSRALLLGALTASLLISWKFGGILQNQSFKGGFAPVARGLTDKDRELYAWVRAQVDKIPPRASVGTTNRLGEHVSNRKEAFFYPEHSEVEWLFIDESELKGADLDKHTKALQGGAFALVARRATLALFQKKK